MPTKKIRLDQFLVEKGLAPTRSKAQSLILSGTVRRQDRVLTKAGEWVRPGDEIHLTQRQKYVSRGGDKLEGALQDFGLSPRGLTCLDIGSSTGGFTDCLLQMGATRVYAVDVGRNQLIDSLKKDPRVLSFEQTHVMEFSRNQMSEPPQFCVIDVSFISLKKILGHVRSLVPDSVAVVALVKPQFEVGPQFLKKGVVRSAEKQQQAVREIQAFASHVGFEVGGQTPSRLKGPKGNQEYFICLKTVPASSPPHTGEGWRAD